MQIITIDGNCGGDPDARYNDAGKRFVTLNVAVSDGKRDRDGEWRERTNWYRVHVPERQCDYVMDRAQRGTQVFASGRLQVDTYESKDGETRYSFDVWASDITLGARAVRAESDDREDRQERQQPAQQSTRSNASSGSRPATRRKEPPADEDPNLDDLPF